MKRQELLINNLTNMRGKMGLGATELAQRSELYWKLKGESGAHQGPSAKLAVQHKIGVGIYKLGFPKHHSNAVSLRKVSTATSPEGFKVTPYLKALELCMMEDSGIVEQVGATYGLQVKRADGQEAYWVIDAKDGKGSVKFNSTVKPDVTLVISDNDAIDLLLGELDPRNAFFSGKLKLHGDIRMGMKLAELKSAWASKL